MKNQTAIKTTRKNIKETNYEIVSVPADVWQDVVGALHLLRLAPYAYIIGVNGRTDVYHGGYGVAVTVTTGGRSFGRSYDRDRLVMWRDVARLARTFDEQCAVIDGIAQDMLGNDPMQLHHTSLARGYVSRRGTGHMEAYKGRFGLGVTYHAPSHNMTSYHPVSYYVL